MEYVIQDGPRRVSHIALRRLAPRAARVLDKNADKDPALAALGVSLEPTIATFERVYDAHKVRVSRRASMTASARATVRRLEHAVGIWLVLVASDLGVDPARFRAPTGVPDDVIALASQLVRLLEEHMAGNESPTPAAAQAIADLAPRIAEARAQWVEARKAMTELQEEAQQVRNAAQELHAGLVVLRRVLRRVIGSRHLDYQTLRVERSREDGEDTVATDAAVVETGTDVASANSPSPAAGGAVMSDVQVGTELDAVAAE
jgi:hypothetical protein